MLSTPETDAAIKAQAQWRRPFISYTMDGITWDGPVADLCRRLERERDEARAELKEKQDATQNTVKLNEEHLCAFHGDVLGNCLVCQLEEIK
jgi:hypothetical protein